LLLHWNGTEWLIVNGNPAGTAFSSVAAVSASDAWTVGTTSAGKTLIEQWDGTTWTQAASPTPGGSGGSELAGVSAVSATDAWAVGGHASGLDPLVLKWNGSTWTINLG
jgi:hypothetical protein